mgnify:CR=1 FL=1
MSFVGKWFGFGRNPHFDNGVRAYEKGAFDVALEQFKICAASEPDAGTRERAKSYQAGCLGKLARASLVSGDSARAVSLLREAVTVRPRFADLLLLLAEAHLADGNEEASAESAVAALAINPQYANALLFLARLNLKQGKGKDAMIHLEQAVLSDGRLAETPHEDVRDYIISGDLPGALNALREVRVPTARDANELAGQGDEHARQARWADAEEAYRQALEIAPRYADIRCRHGQALLELGELEGAANAFREAIAINSNYSEAYALLGVALKRSGDAEGAKDAFHQALSIDPNHPIAKFESGGR